MNSLPKLDAQLWIAIWMGPTAWLLSFLANFALAPWACSFGWKAALFVITAAALAITAASAVSAWKLWRRAGVELPGEMGGAVASARSLGLAGVLLNAMFFLVVLAQGVPNLILGACE
jgi:hypothetical protein